MDTKEQQEFVSRLYNEEDSKLTAEFEKEPGSSYQHNVGEFHQNESRDF